MRILFIITSLCIGGAERQLVDLADLLSERGHEIQIAYLVGLPQLLPCNPDIKVHPIDISKDPFGFIRGYMRLMRIIKDFNPDVVHSHMVHANLLARLVRPTAKIPRLVCTAHNINEGGRHRMLAYRLTDPLADIFTNVSKEAAEAFEAKGAAPVGRILTMHNGIDVQKFSPDCMNREIYRKLFEAGCNKIILAVGRLSEQKDYPNLLNSFSIIAKKSRNIKLWIVGDGPLRASLERLAADLGLSERTKFLGTRPDSQIPGLMRAADIFVLSSAWEGFGLVVAEAMATEKVVVATDSGGVREVVGDCGFLVPAKDSKALAYSLEKALNMPSEQAKELGKKARQRIVKKYSLDSIAERWVEIYTMSRI